MFFHLVKNIFSNKIFGYLSTRYITYFISFISSMYIAVKLGPYYFGIWAFINLLIAVFSNIHFGIANAANILLVQNKNNQQKCDLYVSNAFMLIFPLSLIPLAVFFYDKVFPISYFEKYHLGSFFIPLVFIILLIHLNTLFSNIFRVKNKIFEVAFNQTILPVLIFLLMFFINSKNLVILMFAAYLVANILSIYVYSRTKFLSLKSPFDVNASKEIIFKGFYLFIYNACFYFIILSTKTLISYSYSVQDFGYFSFAFTIANASFLLIDSFMFLIFPKTIQMFKGENFDDIKMKIKSFREKYIVTIQAVIYSAMSVCFIFVQFFEQYKNSYFSLVLIMMTLMLYSNSSGYVNYLLANNYEKTIALFSSIALLINISFVLILIKLFKFSFEYCILGTMVTYFFYTGAIIIFSLNTLRTKGFFNMLKEIFPVNIFIPFGLALFLGLINSVHIVWVPLVFYIIINKYRIINVVKTMKKLILNPNLINVE